MSRDIKFRAWDGVTMLNNVGVLPGIRYVHNDTTSWLLSNNFLMQYTGLKDKNGVEIYEGDMCHFKNRYDGEYTNAIVYYKNGFYLDDGLHGIWDAEDCGVIGNIYENPELLKENK